MKKYKLIFLFLILNCIKSPPCSEFDSSCNNLGYLIPNLFRTTTSNRASNSNPINLTYANPLYSVFLGDSFPTITPSSSGIYTSCIVSPSLPTGLSISPTTCAISGSPTVAGPGSSYQITASTNNFTTTTSIKIKILGPEAFRVYGQFGSFTVNVQNNQGNGTPNGGTANQGSLNYNLGGVTIDANDNVYIADNSNNRVLFYERGSTLASRVYGQNGSFTTTVSGTTATTLSGPSSVSLDSLGNVYISDAANNRVLRYSNNGNTTANFVWGQNGSFTNGTSGAVAIDRFNGAINVFLDKKDNMYISLLDDNHRVLYYPAGSTVPTIAFGQPNVSSGTVGATNPPPSEIKLSRPHGTTVDKDGNVFVFDNANNRVVYYPVGTTTGTIFIGQTSSTTSASTCSSTGLFESSTGAIDVNGNLFVGQSGYHRVSIFTPPFSTGMAASKVLGQTNFNNFTNCTGGIGNNRFTNPFNMAFDSFGNLYVGDATNRRVLVF
jgi:sugar lactone lactonase YvrE